MQYILRQNSFPAVSLWNQTIYVLLKCDDRQAEDRHSHSKRKNYGKTNKGWQVWSNSKGWQRQIPLALKTEEWFFGRMFRLQAGCGGTVTPWVCRQLSLQLSGGFLTFLWGSALWNRGESKQPHSLGLWKERQPSCSVNCLRGYSSLPWKVPPVSRLLSFHLIFIFIYSLTVFLLLQSHFFSGICCMMADEICPSYPY